MHLDLICLLFLSDCSLIIAMLKQLARSPKIISRRWGKDEDVKNRQPGRLGYSWLRRSVPVRLRGGNGICPGPFILMALPSKGWDDSPKGASLQSIYSLLKNHMIIFIKM